MKSFRRLIGLLLVVSIAGCASYPLNQPLRAFDPQQGYRFRNLASPDNSDELFVVLTFSGGGTRAAALAYGVMQQLSSTRIEVDGRSRRLLDEVDVISSVSGGSFTAAYYALFGHEIFNNTFEQRFLKKDIQTALLNEILLPWNWIRLASPTFSRSDLAAEYYDRNIFDRKTFAHVVERGDRPFVIINAADMTLGSPFEFTQDQFDLLYSDLSSFSVARAVAASSAFPILLSPISLRNYNDCPPDFKEPEWIALGLEDRETSPRRFQKAHQLRSYVRASSRPNIHLIDGGVADNLGLRGVIQSLSTTDSDWSLARMINLEKVEKVLIVVVNARPESEYRWDQRAAPPNAIDVAGATISGLMDNYTFETATLLIERIEQLQQDAEARKACQGVLNERNCADTTMPGGPLHEVEFYAVEVSFEGIKDQAIGRYFKDLPTNFALEDKAVECLKKVSAHLLVKSGRFQELVGDLQGTINPVVHPQQLETCR